MQAAQIGTFNSGKQTKVRLLETRRDWETGGPTISINLSRFLTISTYLAYKSDILPI